MDYDGCSSNCYVETDYVCTNSSSPSISTCFYNGPFYLTLENQEKDPNSNSLTLTYSISPYAALLSLNGGSTDLTSLVSFPNNPEITVTEVYLDPITN